MNVTTMVVAQFIFYIISPLVALFIFYFTPLLKKRVDTRYELMNHIQKIYEIILSYDTSRINTWGNRHRNVLLNKSNREMIERIRLARLCNNYLGNGFLWLRLKRRKLVEETLCQILINRYNENEICDKKLMLLMEAFNPFLKTLRKQIYKNIENNIPQMYICQEHYDDHRR